MIHQVVVHGLRIHSGIFTAYRYSTRFASMIFGQMWTFSCFPVPNFQKCFENERNVSINLFKILKIDCCIPPLEKIGSKRSLNFSCKNCNLQETPIFDEVFARLRRNTGRIIGHVYFRIEHYVHEPSGPTVLIWRGVAILLPQPTWVDRFSRRGSPLLSLQGGEPRWPSTLSDWRPRNGRSWQGWSRRDARIKLKWLYPSIELGWSTSARFPWLQNEDLKRGLIVSECSVRSEIAVRFGEEYSS